MDREQQFICPECGKMHIRSGRTVEGYIACHCGRALYVFGNGTTNLTTSYLGLQKPGVAGSLEAFLKRIRVNEAQMAKKDLYAALRQMNALELLSIALEKFQMEVFGEEYLGIGDVQLLCEYLTEYNAVTVKKMQHGLVMIHPQEKLRERHMKIVNFPYSQDTIDSSKELADWQKPQALNLAENNEQRPG